MIKVETHQNYINKVTMDENLQERWAARIGHLVLSKDITIPKLDLWSKRANKNTTLHALNESDIIFLGTEFKDKFYWIPRMGDLIDMIQDVTGVSIVDIFDRLNAKLKGMATGEGKSEVSRTVEEHLYDTLELYLP